jgi:hypothetical protein
MREKGAWKKAGCTWGERLFQQEAEHSTSPADACGKGMLTGWLLKRFLMVARGIGLGNRGVQTGMPGFPFRIAKTPLKRQCKYIDHTHFQLCESSRHRHSGTI